MANDHVRVKTSTTIPHKDGRHVVYNAGDVVPLSETADFFREKLDGNDPWLDRVVESASASDYKKYVEESRVQHTDPGAVAMIEVEELTKKRAELPVEDRHGYAETPESLPVRLDPGRTLPENGADTPANNKFAEGSADTSEDGKDRGVQQEELMKKLRDSSKAKRQAAAETADLSKAEHKKAEEVASKQSDAQGGVPPKGSGK